MTLMYKKKQIAVLKLVTEKKKKKELTVLRERKNWKKERKEKIYYNPPEKFQIVNSVKKGKLLISETREGDCKNK